MIAFGDDLGAAEVVAQPRRLHTSGFLTWLAWVFIHILSLPQLQNRLRVQHQWLWSYFTGQRSSRLIPEPPLTPGTSQVTDVCREHVGNPAPTRAGATDVTTPQTGR